MIYTPTSQETVDLQLFGLVSKNILHVSKMMDACHYTFVKTHRIIT